MKKTKAKYTNVTNSQKTEGENEKRAHRGCDWKRGRKRKKGGISEKHSCGLSVSVFSENVAGGHFSISNPISLRDPVSVAADCWSPLEPCDRAREGATAPYWPFIWTHGGHIASL